MDDDSHSRFRKVEKPRERLADKPAPLASPGRFGKAPPPPVATALDEPAPGRHERFRQQQRPLEEVPEVAEAEPPGSQPFQRCVSCEADSSRFAQRCQNCGFRLDTPEQRAFNEWVWTRRRDEDARTDAALAEMNEAREASAEALARTQRELGEQLAREVAARERDRLSWMADDDGHGQGAGRRETPGLRLLRNIPSTRARLIVAIALFGIGCVFAYVFVRGTGMGRVAAIAFFYAMISLFTPGGVRRRRWFRR